MYNISGKGLNFRRNMLKNKIIALFLCICLLASTALLFSSCGKKTIDLKNEYVNLGNKENLFEIGNIHKIEKNIHFLMKK